MKALSVKNPWAYLIASGQKTIETRTWATKYRGDVLICSSQRPVDTHRYIEIMCATGHNIHSILMADQVIPNGQALAVATITDCRPMTEADEAAACCNIYGGAWAWELNNVRALKPFPVKGRLGLWEYKRGCGSCRDKYKCNYHGGPAISCFEWFPFEPLFLPLNQSLEKAGQA